MVGVKGRSGNPEAYKYGFGSRPIEVDEEYRSRQKGVPHKFVWTKEKCTIELEECLTYLRKILRKDNSEQYDEKNIKSAVLMMDKILDFMKYLYPPIQKSLNVNIDNTEAKKMQEIWTICQQEENEQQTTKQRPDKRKGNKREKC